MTTTNNYHATPFDMSATGFYFHNFEDYEVKARNHRNENGDLIDKFEIQNVAGDNYQLFNALRSKRLTTALRSFLNYARYSGDVTQDLAAAVPSVAHWSMSSIPRAISKDQVNQLLNSIDRDTPLGCRDYAILLLLARLGLTIVGIHRQTPRDQRANILSQVTIFTHSQDITCTSEII